MKSNDGYNLSYIFEQLRVVMELRPFLASFLGIKKLQSGRVGTIFTWLDVSKHVIDIHKVSSVFDRVQGSQVTSISSFNLLGILQNAESNCYDEKAGIQLKT